MAFVQFPNSDVEAQWRSLQMSIGRPDTTLQGVDLPVHALPEDVLEDLQESDIPFTIVDEAQLWDCLSPRGYEYYEHLKQQHPELLYWDATLPPAHCIEISFVTREVYRERAIQILEQLGGFEIQTDSTKGIVRIVIDSGQTDPVSEAPSHQVEIRSFLPAEQFDTLLRQLAEAGIAGYDRSTQILILQDPDKRMSQ